MYAIPTFAALFALASAAAPPWDAVVRIEVAAVAPSYMRPWEKAAQQRQGGTGFLVDGRRILTNHHVIENAVDIRLSKTGNSKRWRARVVAMGPDVDLAALEVIENTDEFFADLTPVAWSYELPPLQSRVTVRGYPLGGNAQSVTEGVVSRVDCKNYRLGATSSISPGRSLVVQIDAAINGGNSGGPAFDASNRVIGVAFQGIDGAQSIGYIIPALLARTFLTAVASAPKFRLADVPFRIQHLENRGLRRYLQVPDRVTGVVVSAVSSLSAFAPLPQQTNASITATQGGRCTCSNASSAASLAAPSTPAAVGANWSSLPQHASAHHGAPSTPAAVGANASALSIALANCSLQPNDVITHLDGVSVGDDGTVPLRPGERVSLDYLITSKVHDTPTELSILRYGRSLTLRAQLVPLPPPLPRWHDFDCTPEWVVIGGLVFSPLTAPLIEDASSGGVRSYVHDIFTREVGAKNGFNTEPAREVVVLLDVLTGGDVNHGYEAEGWKVLTHLNGQPVESIAGLYFLWQQATREGTAFLEFGFGGGTERKIVLEQAAVRESEGLLLNLHGIPARASAGVIANSLKLKPPSVRSGGAAHEAAGAAGVSVGSWPALADGLIDHLQETRKHLAHAHGEGQQQQQQQQLGGPETVALWQQPHRATREATHEATSVQAPSSPLPPSAVSLTTVAAVTVSSDQQEQKVVVEATVIGIGQQANGAQAVAAAKNKGHTTEEGAGHGKRGGGHRAKPRDPRQHRE